MAHKRKRKHGGHYCWCCGTVRANEAFTGKGYKRNLCRQCRQLGRNELKFQQVLRDMEECTDFDGRIFWKRRRQFQNYLRHKNPRIRAAAEEMLAEHLRVQEERRRANGDYDNITFEAVLEDLETEQNYINGQLDEAAELDRCPSANLLRALQQEQDYVNDRLDEAAETSRFLNNGKSSF